MTNDYRLISLKSKKHLIFNCLFCVHGVGCAARIILAITTVRLYVSLSKTNFIFRKGITGKLSALLKWWILFSVLTTVKCILEIQQRRSDILLCHFMIPISGWKSVSEIHRKAYLSQRGITVYTLSPLPAPWSFKVRNDNGDYVQL